MIRLMGALLRQGKQNSFALNRVVVTVVFGLGRVNKGIFEQGTKLLFNKGSKFHAVQPPVCASKGRGAEFVGILASVERLNGLAKGKVVPALDGRMRENNGLPAEAVRRPVGAATESR